MKPPCVSVASQMLPALRVLVARNLVETHGLKPSVAALKMGVTPAAVTQYLSGVRGSKLVDALGESDRVRHLLDGFVKELLKECPDRLTTMAAVCELCRAAREERILCRFCEIVADIGADRCDLCSRLSR
jgi:predicted transcriptional regulator